MRITGKGSMRFDRKNKVAYVRFSTGRRSEAEGGGYGQILKTFHGVSTKAEAWEAADAFRRAVNMGIDPDGGKLTVRQWADEWVRRREASGGLRPNSLRAYRTQLAHVCRHVGQVALEETTPATVSRLQEAVVAEGGGVKVAHSAARMLKRLVTDAAAEGLLPYDRLARVSLPKPARGQRRALTRQEAERLRNEAMEGSDGLSAAIVLGVSIGCRVGEVLGLTWADVTPVTAIGLDGRAHALAIVSIDKQVTKDGDAEPPKTRASTRQVYADEACAAWLDSWRAAQRGKAEALGMVWSPSWQVCTGKRLQPMRQTTFSGEWRSWRERHGFGDLNYHELRHTMATLKLAAGVDIKTVQHDGGWASASVLLGTYAHVATERLPLSAIAYGEQLGAGKCRIGAEPSGLSGHDGGAAMPERARKSS